MTEDVRPTPERHPVGRGRGMPTRRGFLASIAAGLTVVVPAIRVLLDGDTPAKADPAHNHCGWCNTYTTYVGHYCDNGRWVGVYKSFCKICGYVCSIWTDDEGPCN